MAEDLVALREAFRPVLAAVPAVAFRDHDSKLVGWALIASDCI